MCRGVGKRTPYLNRSKRLQSQIQHERMPVDLPPKVRISSKNVPRKVHAITKLEVIQGLTDGLTPKKIAQRHRSSFRTVREYINRLAEQHGVCSDNRTRFNYIQLAVKLTVESMGHEASISQLGFCSGVPSNHCNACGQPIRRAGSSIHVPAGR